MNKYDVMYMGNSKRNKGNVVRNVCICACVCVCVYIVLHVVDRAALDSMLDRAVDYLIRNSTYTKPVYVVG